MAGLQYHFFPTDFFYPTEKSANADSTKKMLISVQTQEKADSHDGRQARTAMQQVDKFSPIQHSSSLAPTPIQKKKSKRDGFRNAS